MSGWVMRAPDEPPLHRSHLHAADQQEHNSHTTLLLSPHASLALPDLSCVCAAWCRRGACPSRPPRAMPQRRAAAANMHVQRKKKRKRWIMGPSQIRAVLTNYPSSFHFLRSISSVAIRRLAAVRCLLAAPRLEV